MSYLSNESAGKIRSARATGKINRHVCFSFAAGSFPISHCYNSFLCQHQRRFSRERVIMANCDQTNRSIIQVESRKRSSLHESLICFSKWKQVKPVMSSLRVCSVLSDARLCLLMVRYLFRAVEEKVIGVDQIFFQADSLFETHLWVWGEFAWFFFVFFFSSSKSQIMSF